MEESSAARQDSVLRQPTTSYSEKISLIISNLLNSRTMKKYFILISAAILTLACTKELTDNQEAYDGEYKTITFESVMTKTTLADDGAVAWESGDQISIYYVNAEGAAAEAVATATSAGATSTFTAEIPVADNPTEYYAAYPAGSGELSVDPDTKAVSFTVNVDPLTCDGSFKSANFSAAYTKSETMAFAFKNAVALIKIALPEGGVFTHEGTDYKIERVYIRGQEAGFKNVGKLPVTVADGAVSAFGDAPGASNVRTGEFSAKVLDSGYAYIPSAPGTWTKGICVRYETDNGALPAVLSKPDAVITITRGEIVTLMDLTSKVIFDYYVAPEAKGTGDGLSEANAMSLADMQAMLDLTSKIYGTYRLESTTFHMLTGETYTLSQSLKFPTPVASAGGYKLTVEGNGAQAVLDGNKSVGVIEVGERVNLTLNKITIQNGSGVKGAGLRLAWSTDATDNNCVVTCNDCFFSANVSPTTGGGLYVTDGATGGQVRCNLCCFSGNKSTSGGGGAAYNVSGAALMFNKCSFTGNTGTADGMCIYSKSRLGLNNTTINAGNLEKNNGAAISMTNYNVIANSTIWCSSALGNRGLLSMGIHKDLNDTKGSAVINCFLHNPAPEAKGYKAFWLHGNYYQNISNCIYNGLSENDNPVYTLTNSVEFTGAAEGKSTDNKKINGVQHYAYKWTWTDAYKAGMTPVTVEEVNTAMEAVPNIGPLFMAWLNTIPNALDTDIYGVSRTPASCPGSYQQAGTPAGK